MPALRERGESPEAAARRLRYAALELVRSEAGAGRILTAHHREDQVETLLLQLQRGVPLERLGGIAARRGALRRPLLELPRVALLAELAARRIVPVDDPTNRDRAVPRNRLRHEILPRLREREPGLDEALLELVVRTRTLQERLQRHFEQRVPAAGEATSSAPPSSRSPAEVPADWLVKLPEPLQLPALRWLLQGRLGLSRLPSLPSLESFLRQIRRQGSGRLRLPEARTGDLVAARGALRREAPRSRTPPFTYSFSIPGEVELPELGLRLRIRRAPVEPWMFRGDPDRAALAGDAAHATVRNRRPGDRLRPLGAAGARKLKELLIDRRVPAAARDRLPLVELGGKLAWVPGVAIDDAFRLTGESECWLAEMIPSAQPLTEGEAKGERMSRT